MINEEDESGSNLGNDLDIGDMVGTFKGIADNPLSKLLLKKSLEHCKKDKTSRLEVGLELYFNHREEACLTCLILSKIISFIIDKGSKNFGVSEEDLREIMKDSYWVKGLRSVIQGIALFGVQKPFIPGAPFQVVWNLSRACNMKCAHCYENAGKRDNDELDPKEIIKGIEILNQAGVTSVAFSGGEPSVHPHILNFIRHTRDVGMFPAMATNGYTISKKKVCNKFVDAGLKFIQISVDGVDPYTHDSFRGVTGAWEKAINAVENCVNADIFVEVATTVTEHNYNEIPDLIDFARDLGANWFMIYNFIPTGNGADIVNMDLSPQKRSNLLKKAYKENSKGEMQILSTAPQYAMVAESLISQESSVIPTHFYNPEYSNSTVKQIADFVGGCGAGRFYMSIEPNGDMYPCVFFPHEYELKLGNLLKDNFQDVWTNNKLLKTLRNKEILEGHCGECESKEKCGGCRARAFNYFHDVLAPDPGCVNHTEEWNQIRSNLVADTYEELANGILVDLD